MGLRYDEGEDADLHAVEDRNNSASTVRCGAASGSAEPQSNANPKACTARKMSTPSRRWDPNWERTRFSVISRRALVYCASSRSLEESEQYAETIIAQEGDFITVRLATGA
uniref:Uncharacterized protein n=1 Tax=Hyaloperonospora arabidopsidis (strain Emoy2) TaxID=559515 RepID=M4B6C1_HYAAE